MSSIYSLPPTDRAKESVANISYQPFWQSTIDRAETVSIPPTHSTDVLIVGGGFTGLWSAIQLRTRFPYLGITLVDKAEFAGEATSRNGGFIHSTLTHGFENSLHHWPEETPELIRLGNDNLQEIKSFIDEFGIECDWVDGGELEIALDSSQVDDLKLQVAKAQELNLDWKFLDYEALQSRVQNPKLLAASFDPHGVATINPAKLARGLIRYLEGRNVQLFQNTEVQKITLKDNICIVEHHSGEIRASKVIVASGAHFFAHSLSRMRTIPIYDYCIVSRVLDAAELDMIGWDNREGLIDSGNQFHYYRITPDNRILWGGYAANYHYGNKIQDSLIYQQHEFEQLAQDFFSLFENLAHLDFEYGWGGVIDTCSRFVPFFHLSHKSKVVQAAGFTGLGVATSRFAAEVMIDLLFDVQTPRRKLSLVREKPVPFPPEPLRSLSIWLTRRSLLHEDKTGRRNLWLRILDACGVGFDS